MDGIRCCVTSSWVLPTADADVVLAGLKAQRVCCQRPESSSSLEDTAWRAALHYVGHQLPSL